MLFEKSASNTRPTAAGTQEKTFYFLFVLKSPPPIVLHRFDSNCFLEDAIVSLSRPLLVFLEKLTMQNKGSSTCLKVKQKSNGARQWPDFNSNLRRLGCNRTKRDDVSDKKKIHFTVLGQLGDGSGAVGEAVRWQR